MNTGAETVPAAVICGATPVLVFAVTSFGAEVVAEAVVSDPVKVGALLVPAGVPALTELVAWDAVPVNVGAATDPVSVACVPVKVGCEIVPAGVYEPPPVVPGFAAAAAPLMNLLRRSGVPLFPSHNNHPDGMALRRPPHIRIIPAGRTGTNAAPVPINNSFVSVAHTGSPAAAEAGRLALSPRFSLSVDI